MKNFIKMKNHLLYEKFIKITLQSFIISSLIAAISSLICWLFSYTKIIIPILSFAISFIISFILFNILININNMEIAKQLDKYGNLDERAITMEENKTKSDYIYQKQKDDAKQHINNLTLKKLKFKISRVLICITCICLIISLGSITALSLSLKGTIPSIEDIIDSSKQEKFFTIRYQVEGSGLIFGEEEQIIRPGESGTFVIAEPEDGWIFVRWDDGIKTPERKDDNISDDRTITAIFEKIEEVIDDDNFDNNRQEADKDGNVPDSSNSDDGSGSNGTNGSGEQGNGSGDKGNGAGSGNDGQDGEGKGNGRGDGAGGNWTPGNQVIDGKTDYRDVYDNYYNEAMEIVRNGGELPEYLKEFIEKYYTSI